MKSYLIDVPVLLIFFTRPEKFSKVFEQVKVARPSKLYLYQDGPRDNNAKDLEGIKQCREIVSTIDWDCEVFRYYQDKNVGCDPSEFIAQKWMFEKEEMGIILEDDDVPSQSFFIYCKDLLERYKYDERINMICGMNNVGMSEESKESYFYTSKGSIWGWASWKRVLNTWDEKYSWLEDKGVVDSLQNKFENVKEYNDFIETAKKHKQSGKAHYETINGASQYLYNRLNIVPKYNMISNIGVGENSTHNVDDIRLLPKMIRKLMYMETNEIEFPLNHPKYIIPNRIFEKKMSFTTLQKKLVLIESILLRLKYGRYKDLSKSFKRKILKK
ncbi:hypothetical protein ACQKDD_17630 [Planococcus kocurii]|uniref:hypothetical protein n=1 Tax=Planococcus kocurii TaxID=1374 RepID=UPI003CFF0CA8